MQIQLIQSRIYTLRGYKVMLDFDLAELYETETRTLKQSVRRNQERFPEDFMFQLAKSEWKELITICDNLPENIQFSPTTPFAFTEQGVAMLSGVLKSKKAIQTNIAIMRAFVAVRQFALNYVELSQKIMEIEKHLNGQDESIKDIFQAIHYLLKENEETQNQKDRKKIGFKN